MLDNFFHTISKWTIIIPLGILLLVLLLMPEKKQNTLQQVVQPTPTNTVGQAIQQPENIMKNIDPSKSYICKYASMSAYIKNKRVLVENKKATETDYALFRDGCLYLWEKGEFSGDKTCGLGQYVSTFESLSRLGLVEPENLLSTVFEASGDIIGTGEAQIKNFVNSCKQTEIKDNKIFEVPKSILFKNKKL